MTIKDKKFIDRFIQSSIASALESIKGLPYEDLNSQLVFYKTLCEDLGYNFSQIIDDFDDDSLMYEKYKIHSN